MLSCNSFLKNINAPFIDRFFFPVMERRSFPWKSWAPVIDHEPPTRASRDSGSADISCGDCSCFCRG
jgi:hypothetical protein